MKSIYPSDMRILLFKFALFSVGWSIPNGYSLPSLLYLSRRDIHTSSSNLTGSTPYDPSPNEYFTMVIDEPQLPQINAKPVTVHAFNNLMIAMNATKSDSIFVWRKNREDKEQLLWVREDRNEIPVAVAPNYPYIVAQNFDKIIENTRQSMAQVFTKIPETLGSKSQIKKVLTKSVDNIANMFKPIGRQEIKTHLSVCSSKENRLPDLFYDISKKYAVRNNCRNVRIAFKTLRNREILDKNRETNGRISSPPRLYKRVYPEESVKAIKHILRKLEYTNESDVDRAKAQRIADLETIVLESKTLEEAKKNFEEYLAMQLLSPNFREVDSCPPEEIEKLNLPPRFKPWEVTDYKTITSASERILPNGHFQIPRSHVKNFKKSFYTYLKSKDYVPKDNSAPGTSKAEKTSKDDVPPVKTKEKNLLRSWFDKLVTKKFTAGISPDSSFFGSNIAEEFHKPGDDVDGKKPDAGRAWSFGNGNDKRDGKSYVFDEVGETKYFRSSLAGSPLRPHLTQLIPQDNGSIVNSNDKPQPTTVASNTGAIRKVQSPRPPERPPRLPKVHQGTRRDDDSLPIVHDNKPGEARGDKKETSAEEDEYKYIDGLLKPLPMPPTATPSKETKISMPERPYFV